MTNTILEIINFYTAIHITTAICLFGVSFLIYLYEWRKPAKKIFIGWLYWPVILLFYYTYILFFTDDKND